MSALSGDHTGCSVLIYDTQGNHLINTRVTHHDRKALRISIKESPDCLKLGDAYRLLVMSSPAPCEYMGRITKETQKQFFALYHGHEKEGRGAVRYKVNFPAMIENLIVEGKAYPLHTSLEIELINISKSGIRFRAPRLSLPDEARFQMRMKIGDGEKLLIADMVNYMDKDDGTTDYGCKFLIGSEKVV